MNSALLVAVVVLSVTMVAADGDWPGFPRKRSLGNRDSFANINDYVDQILENVKIYLEENDMEPLALPDKLLYNFTIELIVTSRTLLGLHDGEIRNLTTLHRIGDSNLTYISGSRTLQLDTIVQFDKCVAFYKFADQFLNIGPHGTVTATLSGLNASLSIDLQLLSGNATLREFKLDTAKSINTHVTGLTWLGNLITDGFMKLFTLFFKGPILGYVESEVKRALAGAISSSDPVSTSNLTYSR